MNEDDDISKGLGKGNTFFHESAHMIDYLNDNLSAELTDCIRQDYENNLSRIINATGCSYTDAQIKLSDELWEYPTESNCVSDVFGGISCNQVSGAWGHSTEYWNTRPSSIIGAEAFAEITADSACSQENLKFTKQYMPLTYEKYKSIITRRL